MAKPSEIGSQQKRTYLIDLHEEKKCKGNWTLKICPSVFDLNMSINWQKLKGRNRVSVPLKRNVGMKRMQTTSGHETISFQSMVLIFIFFLNFGIWANNYVLWLRCEDCVYDTVPSLPSATLCIRRNVEICVTSYLDVIFLQTFHSILVYSFLHRQTDFCTEKIWARSKLIDINAHYHMWTIFVLWSISYQTW